MKVLMLGWELPPHNSGGLGVACFSLAKALAKEGAEIDFVLPYNAKHDDIKFMRILSALRLDPLCRYGGGSYATDRLEEAVIPAGGKRENLTIRDVQREYCDFIKSYLKDNRPDVVHAHDWLTYEAGVLAKQCYNIPLVVHVHATEFDRAGMHSGNNLVHEIEYAGLVAADKVIAVSETTKNMIHEKYAIPLEKIEVAYNSLGDEFIGEKYHFNEFNYPYLRHLRQDGWTIVSTVGRFTLQKGLVHLLNAAARAIRKEPKLLFILAGDGEERDELIERAAQLGITQNVIFTGFVRGKKLRDIYSVSDIFVMSSISEPFGLTALEAAHYGNVLILTKQSGVAEILKSTLQYDFWDERKLADEIIAIAKNPSLKRTLQKNIAKEYRRISWRDIARKCLAIYNETRGKD